MRGKPRIDGDLRRKIEEIASKDSNLTAAEISFRLRSIDSRYRRRQQQPFTRKVQEILEDIRSKQTPKPATSDVAQGPARKRSRLLATSSSDSDSDSMDDSSDSDFTKSVLRKSYSKIATKLKPELVEILQRLEERVKRLEEIKSKKGIVPMSTSSSDSDSDITKSIPRTGYSKKVANPGNNVANNKSPQKSDHFVGSENGSIEDGPRFKDFGGMREIIDYLKKKVLFPFENEQALKKIKKKPRKGILLVGLPGCGKTMLAHAIANEAGIPFYKVAATELVSPFSGASEGNIRELFAKAHQTAPSIIFIDEIDGIGCKRENQGRGMEIRILNQLLSCMDGSHKKVRASDTGSNAAAKSDYVLVIGATNRPDALDPALRRRGRFDLEIALSVPDEKARLDILSVLISDCEVEGEAFDLRKIAQSTPGYVGADLAALLDEAGDLALERIFAKRKSDLSKEPLDGDHAEDYVRPPLSAEEEESLCLTMENFEQAVKLAQPSSKREGFSSIPNVKWEDVGGLPALRKDLDRLIIKPINNPEKYEKVKLDFGFLLYGPPGCGKTLIAKAVANEAGANFIHIKGPELMTKYVGESELAVRTIFKRARTCAPCIVFFDEIDSLTASGDTEGSRVADRLKDQLLVELSGSDPRRYVFIIGATNRPEMIDRALLRSGRLGKLVHVSLPNADERGSILEALAREQSVDPSVDLLAFGRDEACEDLSGADLSALMNYAALTACEESETSSWMIKKEHLEEALNNIYPSVSEEQKQWYFDFEENLKACTKRKRKRKALKSLESS